MAMIIGDQILHGLGHEEPTPVVKYCLNCEGVYSDTTSLYCCESCKEDFRLNVKDRTARMKELKTLKKNERKREYKERMAINREQPANREKFLKEGAGK